MQNLLDALAAANHLVGRYDAFDIEGYLACFAYDATFDFYISDRTFESRAEWAEELAAMVAAGFRVVSCRSANQRMQLVDNVAIFRHCVTTTIVNPDGTEETLLERETIVFALREGRWVAIHEHLSPLPSTQEPNLDVVVGHEGDIRTGGKVIGNVSDQTVS